MPHRFYSLALAATACFTLLSAGPAMAVDRSGELQIGAITRTYSMHIPNGRAPVGGFPMVLVFHGGGGQGATIRRTTGFDAVADARRFIVVYPDGIDRHWNDGRSTIRNPQDDVGFVSALLDDLQRRYRVNQRRVYATGLSNGALFTQRLGCDLSQRISAIAPVAGTLPADLIGRCRPVRPIGVLQIDGTADPIMPYQGGKVKDFGGRGEGGQVTSVARTIVFWATRNGCGARLGPQSLPKRRPLDPTRVTRISFARCPARGQVTHLAVEGGGHVWPGSDQRARPFITGRPSQQIDASEVIARFFLDR